MPELTLAATLQTVTSRMATNVRDWSDTETDAFLYGVLVGWDCEEQHEHDEVMCCVDALDEVAGRYGWPEEQAATLREMRRVIARWSL